MDSIGILQGGNVESLLRTLIKMVDNLEKKVERVLSIVDVGQSNLKMTRRKVEKEKVPDKKPDEEVPKSTETGNNCHKTVLKEKHSKLLEQLDLSNTCTLDNMLQNDAITPTDQEEIKSHQTRRDKVRYLLVRICKYDENNFHKFVESLQDEHKELAEELKDAMTSTKENGTTTDAACLHCQIRSRVDVSDVIDGLYEKRIIGTREMTLFLKHGWSNKTLWDRILFKISRCKSSSNNPVETIRECLEGKYSDLCSALRDVDKSKIVFCDCRCTFEDRRSFASSVSSVYNLKIPIPLSRSASLESNKSSSGSVPRCSTEIPDIQLDLA